MLIERRCKDLWMCIEIYGGILNIMQKYANKNNKIKFYIWINKKTINRWKAIIDCVYDSVEK